MSKERINSAEFSEEDWEDITEVTHLRDTVAVALRKSQANLEEQGEKAEKLSDDLRNGGGPKFLAILGFPEKVPA